MNFKLTCIRLCSTKTLLYAGSGGIRYLNSLVLGNILVIFVSLKILKILCIIDTEEPMETEFVWRGHIYVYQCSFLPVRSQNMSLNLGGLNLSSIFLNGWVTHFCVKISKCSLLMYTALLKILWNAIYC